MGASLPARDYSTASTMSVDDGHLRVTYNEIHKLIGAAAERIKNEFKYAPSIMAASQPGFDASFARVAPFRFPRD